MPTDEEVVQTAAEAAEGVIFARYKQSDVTDFDVTVTFEDGVLDVDVYVNVPDEVAPPDEGRINVDEGTEMPDSEAVADEAARAATEAVDELFESDADASD